LDTTKSVAAAVVCALFWVGPLQQSQQPIAAKTLEVLNVYRAAVDDYRAKRTEAAIAALKALDHEQLTIILHLIEASHPARPEAPRKNDVLVAWDLQTLLAAGMLHVDTALAGTEGFRFQADMGMALLRLADAQGSVSRDRSTERRATRALARLLVYEASDDVALSFTGDAVLRFPDDAPLLTTLGMLHEGSAERLRQPTMWINSSMFERARASRNWHLHDARALFERALAADAASVEARVRLARVDTLVRDDKRAEALLDPVLAGKPAAEWRYMALMILGSIRERAGHRDEAVRLYESAIAAQPDGQSAYLASSHAAYAAGDRDGAKRALERMFARALTATSADPWWDYQFGEGASAKELLDALREEATR
jgi:tetratricopeptide (TPR) repeat protein